MRFEFMEAVDYYTERARSGHPEDAFFGSLELGEDPVPALMESYGDEQDPNIRALIVQIIWERRQPSAIPFLAEALLDPEAEAWKQAIDGLVALGTVEVRMALALALEGMVGLDSQRRAWISEALTDWGDLHGRWA